MELLLPREEETFRDLATCFGSSSAKAMQTAKDRGCILPRVSPSRGRTFGKKALRVHFGASGVTE